MATETFLPSGRDHLLKSATRWLNYKRQDDDIGKGLWRVHDGLYDLRSFRHPGGAEWIQMTEGQDITEAFEAAHIRFAYTEKILKKYFVKKIETPRNSLTTFESDGFYRTLRAKAAKVMYSAQVGGPGPGFKTFALQDSLVLLFLLLLAYTCVSNSMYWAVICGIVLGMNTSAAHNFFHQADSWRRYYWDLSLLSSRDWRVSHMLSHHLHTNTYNDIEIYGIEPFVSFLPTKKNWLQKYLSHGYINVFYLVAFPSEYIKKIIMVSTGEDTLRPENLLPLFEFVALLYGLQMAFGRALVLWLTIHAFSGFWLIFTSLIASHHHPDIYHAGDTPRKETDWGLRQLDTTRDVANKAENFFLVATTFGHHTLHHLFPTVDHSKLHFLYPVLEETCKEFGVEYKPLPQWNMFLGMHQQLMRTQPKANFLL